jgi:hypothetical protein
MTCKWFLPLALLGAMLAASVGFAAEPAAEMKTEAKADKDGWVELFDGKTLNGWKANEHADNWKVVDGAIVTKGLRSHLFYVGKGEGGKGDAEFTNFEFSADVMTEKGANSGIFFHTQWQKDGWPEHGYESQVNVSQADPVKTGSLYNVVKLYKTEAQDNKWWTQSIKVEGKHLWISVNGKVVVDYKEPDDVKGPRKLSKGTFALQQHDPTGVTHFKNIKVRELK